MKCFYYTFLVTSIAFTSCKNNDAETAQPDPRMIVPFTQQAASDLQSQPPQQEVAKGHNLFQENNPTSTPSVVAGVNPAHGQPNHRCDIEVGAPLNSPIKNATSNTTQANIQPTPIISNVSTAKKITPKGMNPPHGEPGHRCDISDGARLNSKPITSTTTSSVSDPVKNAEANKSNIPALLATDTPAVITPEGMNPPHGKPGHVCGIAVGDPLSKE
jgi:hypothetical protein